MSKRNEEHAADLMPILLEIYGEQLRTMMASGEIHVGLLKEVREFLKQYNVELDKEAAPLQELSDAHDELQAWKRRKAGL